MYGQCETYGKANLMTRLRRKIKQFFKTKHWGIMLIPITDNHEEEM